jgi:sortase (surface protein transpeptidase)
MNTPPGFTRPACLSYAVFEGDDTSTMEHGVIHQAASAEPGGAGNVVLLGHRTTWNAPFNGLDELQPGDRISLTRDHETFTYQVRAQAPVTDGGPAVGYRIVPRVVPPGADANADPNANIGFPSFPADVLAQPPADSGVHELTLLSYAPKYSAMERIVVEADLVPTR